MTSEGLGGLTAPNIPKFGCSVTSTGDEDVLVGSKGQTELLGSVSITNDSLASSHLITSPV